MNPYLQLADAWLQEADRRKAVTPSDPAADAMIYCAKELRLTVDDEASARRHLTVEQFAERAKVTPQAVRKWIRRGRIEATKGPHGWVIAATQDIPVRQTA